MTVYKVHNCRINFECKQARQSNSSRQKKEDIKSIGSGGLVPMIVHLFTIEMSAEMGVKNCLLLS
jgi:hypothetical protein